MFPQCHESPSLLIQLGRKDRPAHESSIMSSKIQAGSSNVILITTIVDIKVHIVGSFLATSVGFLTAGGEGEGVAFIVGDKVHGCGMTAHAAVGCQLGETGVGLRQASLVALCDGLANTHADGEEGGLDFGGDNRGGGAGCCGVVVVGEVVGAVGGHVGIVF